MSSVQSIRGTIASGDLGRTLAHEHLTNGTSGMQHLPGLLDRQEMIARCIDALDAARGVGIDTIIDLTPFDLGRQPWIFEAVAEASQVKVICATGIYRWVPPIFFAWDADEIAGFFVSEIEDGIQGSSIRAGIIKVAWDIEYRLDVSGPNASPRALLERVARAAARAARATGVPISCHTLAPDKLGTPLLDLFEDEGVALGAVTIGHSNDSDDLEYLLGLASRGAVVGLDRFRSTEEGYVAHRAAIALRLIEAGHAEHVCLSHDAAPAGLWGRWNPSPDPACWTLVSNHEIPWLLANGATPTDVDAMLRRSIQATFEAAAAMTG